MKHLNSKQIPTEANPSSHSLRAMHVVVSSPRTLVTGLETWTSTQLFTTAAPYLGSSYISVWVSHVAPSNSDCFWKGKSCPSFFFPTVSRFIIFMFSPLREFWNAWINRTKRKMEMMACSLLLNILEKIIWQKLFLLEDHHRRESWSMKDQTWHNEGHLTWLPCKNLNSTCPFVNVL